MRLVARLLFVAGIVCPLVSPAVASADDNIESVSVGLGGLYKVGRWCPVHVRIVADGNGFAGRLRVECPDVDDIIVLYGGSLEDGGLPVSLGASEARQYTVYVRPGNRVSQIEAVLIDAAGRELQRVVPDSSQLVPCGEETYVLLGIGTGGILDNSELEAAAGRVNMSRQGQTRIVFVHLPVVSDELPGQWIGYDMVDAVLLSLDDNRTLTELVAEKQQALLNWVRQGGTLVASLGPALPGLADSPLGRRLPVELDGSVHVTDVSELESFAKTPHPLQLPSSGTAVPLMKVRKGRVLASRRGQPVIVQAAEGFGEVIAIAFPISNPGFAQWRGRHDFVAALLPMALWRQPGATAAIRYVARNDLASTLKEWVERFEGVTDIPFQWVALGIFIYILLIGPADYYVVRRVLKRPELTWVTFTVSAVLISAVVWLAAGNLKGRVERVRRIEVVDLNQIEGTARAYGLVSFFSPGPRTLDVSVRQIAPFLRPRADLQPSCVLTWAGVPEDALGGTGRSGSLPLSSREYGFGQNLCELRRVPVYAWGAKSFTWTWGGDCVPVLEADLGAVAGYHLTGTLQNRAGFDLTWLAIVYNRRAYLIKDVQNLAVVRAEDADTLALAAFAKGTWQEEEAVRPLLMATFYRELGDTLDQTNFTLSRLDMSQFATDPSYALALGWQTGVDVAQIEFDGARGERPTTSAVMLRVVLPVRAEQLSREQLLRDQE